MSWRPRSGGPPSGPSPWPPGSGRSTPYRSVCAQNAWGALNIFAERPHGLAAADQLLGQALADVATIGILHERVVQERETLTQHLQAALNSRVALEQAKGVVAEQAGVSVDEAFQLLRSHARHHNRYIGEVVAAVINRALSAADLRLALRSRGSARK